MPETPAKTSAETSPSGPKRASWLRRALWAMALLCGASFAAWQVAVFAMERPLTVQAPLPVDFGQRTPTSTPAGDALPLTADPLAMVEGLRTVRSAPPLAPPPEARPVMAIGRPDTGRDGWVWLIWTYRVPASPESMLEYARSIAGSAGFHEQPMPSRPRSLLFTRDGEVTHVAVQRTADGGTRLSITTQRLGRKDDF